MDVRAIEEALGAPLNLAHMPQGRLEVRTMLEGTVARVEGIVGPYDSGPWLPYDKGARVSYYHARVGDPGGFLMELPPGYNDMARHAHEFSDRVILVRRGEGTFFHIDEKGVPREYAVARGALLSFPLRTRHKFTAGREGLLCADFHMPFFPLEHLLFKKIC